MTAGDDAYVYVDPGTGGSKVPIDMREVAQSGSEGANYRQVVTVGDPTDKDKVAPVDATKGLTVDLYENTAVLYDGDIAAGSLTGSFAVLVNPGVGIRGVQVLNWTDGDVVISLDGGSTTHWILSRGESFKIDYGNKKISNNVQAKQGATVPANGSVYGLAFS